MLQICKLISPRKRESTIHSVTKVGATARASILPPRPHPTSSSSSMTRAAASLMALSAVAAMVCCSLGPVGVGAVGDDEKYVTCGSAIKLTHQESGGEYQLNSAGHNWGGGSGQQVVTLVKDKADQASLWLVREGNDQSQCSAGVPMKCGESIRLTHLQSQRNLHTHHVRSALSGQQEVSGFGEDGEGDFADDWKLICGGKYWHRDANVRFQHVETQKYLSANSKVKFDERNCRNCPIMNNLEVAGSSRLDQNTYFRAELGVFLSK